MKGTLYARRAAVDAACTEALGEPVIYARGGVNPKTIWAQVDYKDKVDALAGSQLTEQDMMVEPLKRDVPVPDKTDRITLPRATGSFYPRDWHNGDGGTTWLIYLARVR